MDAQKQETEQTLEDWEEETDEENLQESEETDIGIEKAESKMAEETSQQKRKRARTKNEQKHGFRLVRSNSSFVHGLAAGLGIGCITAFVLMWVTVYFTPKLASEITYESMLATFIYPLIYLFALGLVALTVGVVSEHYTAEYRLMGNSVVDQELEA